MAPDSTDPGAVAVTQADAPQADAPQADAPQADAPQVLEMVDPEESSGQGPYDEAKVMEEGDAVGDAAGATDAFAAQPAIPPSDADTAESKWMGSSEQDGGIGKISSLDDPGTPESGEGEGETIDDGKDAPQEAMAATKSVELVDAPSGQPLRYGEVHEAVVGEAPVSSSSGQDALLQNDEGTTDVSTQGTAASAAAHNILERVSSSWFSPKRLPHIILRQVPQQQNEYDCGVYMLHFIEILSSSNGSCACFKSSDTLQQAYGRSAAKQAERPCSLHVCKLLCFLMSFFLLSRLSSMVLLAGHCLARMTLIRSDTPCIGASSCSQRNSTSHATTRSSILAS